ncbi:ectoine/hydroxyectoine ABC transporter substrate-binding protein EhuB [Ottowia sp.]
MRKNPKFILRRALLTLAGACALLGAGAASAGVTLEQLREQGFIRVGFANEAPFAYATSSGQLTGESPEVFRHIMNKLGVKSVDGVLTEWGALIPGLRAGRFDAIVASMYITPARCKRVIFADPTYGVGTAMVVKKGNPEGINTYEDAIGNDAKIAFVAGVAEVEQARMAGMKRGQQVLVPDFAAAVANVKSGRAAAAAFTSLTAQDLANKDEELERAQPFDFEHDGKTYRGEGAFAFRPEDTGLRDAVNAELKKFIGTPEHLAMVKEFGFDSSNLPERTAEQHCAGE